MSWGVYRKIRVYSERVDCKLQKVTVRRICNTHDVLATIRSKRKDTRFWDADDNKYHRYDELHDDKEQTIPLRMSKLGRSLSWKALKKVISVKSY
ncbi:hypothetical protein MKW98_019056 [Papaver atlanticum]|uniref:Uncharacterized protein n=1 Tax=Papaver atlanticum TaxID=357466 RepID=A0AAD4TJP3_9MAGN|nr:hypothetical protein MKW98_019056 [Papaver atlanticum]